MSTRGGTVGRYGRATVPLLVNFMRGQEPDPASLVMTPARFLPLNSHDLLQILCIPAHNNKKRDMRDLAIISVLVSNIGRFMCQVAIYTLV